MSALWLPIQFLLFALIGIVGIYSLFRGLITKDKKRVLISFVMILLASISGYITITETIDSM